MAHARPADTARPSVSVAVATIADRALSRADFNGLFVGPPPGIDGAIMEFVSLASTQLNVVDISCCRTRGVRCAFVGTDDDLRMTARESPMFAYSLLPAG